MKTRTVEVGPTPTLLNDTDAVTAQFENQGVSTAEIYRGDGSAPAAGARPFRCPPGFGSEPKALDDIIIGTGARLWAACPHRTTITIAWTEPA